MGGWHSVSPGLAEREIDKLKEEKRVRDGGKKAEREREREK